MKERKPVFIGKAWTITADFGESRGLKNGQVRGYATDAVSARTHEFRFGRRSNAVEVYPNLWVGRTVDPTNPPAPNYVRLAVGKVMRALKR